MDYPRLIAFEGVDGAGKSSVLARVAAALRAQGRRVYLPRLGKDHASLPTRRIRDLTRDAAHLDLVPQAELALYCAREAQLREELIQPALARGELVLMDRSALTPLVLGVFGRGLDRGLCESQTSAAEGRCAPDLTIVFDVHPRTSRLRKRLEKIRSHTPDTGGGRKGLSGSGFSERVRDGYLRLALERHLPVLHAERASVEEMTRRVLALIEQGKTPNELETPADAHPVWRLDPGTSMEQALALLPAEIALYVSGGLAAGRSLRRRHLANESALVAWGLDPGDPSFEASVALHPEYALRARPVADGIEPDPIREKLLAAHPEAVLGSLRGVWTTWADRWRIDHVVTYPDAVLGSLAGREDPLARHLRRTLWRCGSTAARGASLPGCGGTAAWHLRDELLESAPHVALASLAGVHSRRADELLGRYAHKAEKIVLSALVGRKGGFASALRASLVHVGREVVDSLVGLDDEMSWQLRDQLVERYPSTVLHSLLGVPTSSRRQAMRELAEQVGSGDVHVLRRSCELDEAAARPPATMRAGARPPAFEAFERDERWLNA